MGSSRIFSWGCAGWIGMSASIVSAAVTETQAAERARIRGERVAAEASFSARDQECRTHFIVTACVDEARQMRRESLSRLRREESVLEDEVRKQKTAERVRELEENSEREQAPQRDASSPERRKATRASGAPQVIVRPPRAAAPKSASTAAADRSGQEARNQAAFEARREAADAHRQKIEERNAARAASGKVAEPLPIASAASAP